MKTALPFLAMLVTATLPAAEPAAEAPAGKLSPAVSDQVSLSLPKYAPPRPAPAAKPANAPNPDVLELPKITVRQRPRPRLTPEVMYTTKGFNERLAREKLSSLDRNVLNKYTLPFFGVSAETRAREEYEREKKEQLAADVSTIAHAAEQVDPAGAKALRDAATKP